MNQIAIKSDKNRDAKPQTPKYSDELKRRAKELQEYKGER